MPAKLLDGNLLAKKIRNEIAANAIILAAKGTKPGLAVILVGENPASQIYVRNKIKACQDTNIHSVLIQLPQNTSQAELLVQITKLNQDPQIHGILVQLPLPSHIDSYSVIEAIHPKKDVDG
jgi:methylenetetrahydrofolate dehydrogenase (NADP+)/methenyltetrahydrofolate cyclohydrolase